MTKFTQPEKFAGEEGNHWWTLTKKKWRKEEREPLMNA